MPSRRAENDGLNYVMNLNDCHWLGDGGDDVAEECIDQRSILPTQYRPQVALVHLANAQTLNQLLKNNKIKT